MTRLRLTLLCPLGFPNKSNIINSKMAYRLSLLLSLLLAGISLHAQTAIEEIKNNTEYYSAEGDGYDVYDAKNNAMLVINNRIASWVSSSTEESSVTEGGVSYVSQSSEVKQFALTALQDVEYVVLEDEPERARVFCWVAKSDVQKMFDLRRQKALEYIETGKKAEQRLQIDDALRNYYWALMLSRSIPDAMGAVRAEFGGQEEYCQSFLPMKIKSVLAGVNARIDGSVKVGDRYVVHVYLTYEGNDVATLQLHYSDGNSRVGPVTARDGIADLELSALPHDEKLGLRYEYSFRTEAENLDPELRILFREMKAPTIENARVEIPLKVDEKKGTIEAAKKAREGVSSGMVGISESIVSEEVKIPKRIAFTGVDNADSLYAIMTEVENAIRNRSISDVEQYFTREAFGVLDTLVNKTGTITVSSSSPWYDFVDAGDLVLARFCRVRLKFRNGRSFSEGITFRFCKESGKIESLAFALTKKAEADIFNAAASWPEVSRFTILRFMEDYQTAYALKRLHYIDKIYSDEAVIMTGTVLRAKAPLEGKPITLGGSNSVVKYTQMDKREFIDRLRRQFSSREYVHLTYEDNVTKAMNSQYAGKKGTIFAVEIKQYYHSPAYSDEGYLTLVFDVSGQSPLIYVRLWQPDKTTLAKAGGEFKDIDEFVSEIHM